MIPSHTDANKIQKTTQVPLSDSPSVCSEVATEQVENQSSTMMRNEHTPILVNRLSNKGKSAKPSCLMVIERSGKSAIQSRKKTVVSKNDQQATGIGISNSATASRCKERVMRNVKRCAVEGVPLNHSTPKSVKSSDESTDAGPPVSADTCNMRS